MSEQNDRIDHLRASQHEIRGDYGMWGAAGLAQDSAAAAGVGPIPGDPLLIHDLSNAYYKASQSLQDAYNALTEIRKLDVAGTWSGDAHNAATDAMAALHDGALRAFESHGDIGEQLNNYVLVLEPAQRDDGLCADNLRSAAAVAEEMSAGPIPDPLTYDGERMQRTHELAMVAVDGRLAQQVKVRDIGQDFMSAIHDIGDRARAERLGSGLSPLDDVVLAAVGGQVPILSPAMDLRAHEALADPAVRERMAGLLAAARSPEQKAYLLRALAAGYSMDEVAAFDAQIAAHGNDPAWLKDHLSPLSPSDIWKDGKDFNRFGSSTWDQGQHPTCVAASTVTARAQIDPIYALQLTAGGHPGDPAFDNSQAFSDRLLHEQTRLYDDERTWWQDQTDRFRSEKGGLSTGQSTDLANEQLAPHTGAGYHNVGLDDADARANVVAPIERAVDDGYPVPFSTHEDGEGHQMMVIGHSGDQLQIYNPWGYTFWVSEDDFVAGHVDRVDSDIPGTPNSVRLPQAGGR